MTSPNLGNIPPQAQDEPPAVIALVDTTFKAVEKFGITLEQANKLLHSPIQAGYEGPVTSEMLTRAHLRWGDADPTEPSRLEMLRWRHLSQLSKDAILETTLRDIRSLKLARLAVRPFLGRPRDW